MAEAAKTPGDIQAQEPPLRAGVIICQCGDNIAAILDTDVLCTGATALPGVVYTSSEPYPCSKDGRARLCRAITDHKLERVLIAGCTPRLMEKLFRRAAEEAGLNGGFLEVVDIREQCAYVHPSEPAAALEKAANIVEMGVARLAATTLPQRYSSSVVKSAMVIGSGLSGLTVALALADAGIDVTLAEHHGKLGDTLHILQDRGPEIIADRIEAASHHPRIRTLLNARVTEVTGHAGDYTVHVVRGDQGLDLNVGAIVVATGAQSNRPDHGRWLDPTRVATQIDFANALKAAAETNAGLPLHDVVLILDADKDVDAACSGLCYAAGIRQAIQVKQLHPEANVTTLFRDPHLAGAGDMGESLFLQARQSGIALFRYRKDRPPVIGQDAVEVDDPSTGQSVRIPFDRVVLAMPLVPSNDADELAAMLHLPQDNHGFMLERRTRLRPGCYADDAIYVVGGAHQPCDTDEALFQAYLASARILRLLTSDGIVVEPPVAGIDELLCTGCGNCTQVCPTSAISLEKRESLLSLAVVETLRCTGCGNCAVVCPVKAISLPGSDDPAILAQINAALSSPGRMPLQRAAAQPAPRILVLACEWSAYAAADIAGARRMPYPSEVRIVRANCSARFDPYHVLWAFLNGADGVLLGVCPRGECHHGAGNLYAEERVKVLKRQLAEHGVDPRRLRLEFLAPDDGLAFASAMKAFMAEVSS